MTAIIAITLAVVTLTYVKAGQAAGPVPAKLAAEARWVAAHGGVLGSCHDCATQRMKELVRRLIIARFAPEGSRAVRTALCVARGESGYNPGAISHTGDYGVAQVNRQAHEDDHPDWWQPRNGFQVALLDPVFNIGVMWSMSQRGRSWDPWVVWTNGSCS